MKPHLTRICTTTAAAILLLSVPTAAFSQSRLPAIEHSSLLDAFTVKFQGERALGKTGGVLMLNQKHEIMGVFFPEGAQLVVDLVKAGTNQTLFRQNCSLQPSGGSPFTRISVGGAEGFTFREPGDYELRFALDKRIISRMPFRVIFDKQGDDFDPRLYTFVDGDWSNLAYLSFSADDAVSPLKFHTWTKKIVYSTTPRPSKMNVTLMQGDEIVAITPEGTVAWPEWQSREVTFTFPINQVGRVFNNSDLMKRSGEHTVRVDLDGKPHQYFNFKVSDGRILGHTRQRSGHKPHDRWLCPRKIRLGLEGTSHIYWMERSDSAAKVVTSESAAPSTAETTKWTIESSHNDEPLQVTHTNIRMRKDMPLSVGDGIVAYATGSRGVGYFVVGEDKPRSITNGQSFRGDLFFTCGKYILTATRNNVTVFSTELERSVEIPDDEIHLSYQTHALYGPRLMDSDGYLVATVNEPSKLNTKTIINVLDLSGDNRPVTIPIKNSDFELRDVTSVKVNAAAGKVAVGSKRKGAIYVADVASGATFRKYDVSGFDSYGEYDMVLTDSTILYVDAAGFANVRMLDLASGEVTMPDSNQFGGGWGPVGASNGSMFAWAIKEPRKSWAIAGPQAIPFANAGTKSAAEHGPFGIGRSMAMASDGTLFIAGNQSISHSSCLQMGQGEKWQFVLDADGQPIPAIDVVAGPSMVAFKTGKPSTSSEVRISYATFGTNVRLQENVPRGRLEQSTDAQPSESRTERNSSEAAENADLMITEIDRAFLADVVKNETIIFDALKQSFNEADALQRARDAGIKTLKDSGRQHLIDEYKKGWK